MTSKKKENVENISGDNHHNRKRKRCESPQKDDQCVKDRNESDVQSKKKACMKHKKKDKYNRSDTQEKHQKDIKNGKMQTASSKVKDKSAVRTKQKIVIPKDPADVSANWKQLLQSSDDLRNEQRRARKRKKIHKRRNVSPDNEKDTREKSPDIWFDDVDEILLDNLKSKSSSKGKKDDSTETTVNPLVKPESFTGRTKIIAMDCEMVGVGEGGKDSILARVSIVNQYGQCIYDKHVRPTEAVTDYRTFVSGIRPQDIKNADQFADVQKEVDDILQGRILVGHAISNDLKVLYLSHPRKMIRDTQTYRPFKALFNGKKPALRKLSAEVLNVPIQTGEHNSIQDAQATMRLYTMYRKKWEKEITLGKSNKSSGPVRKKKKKSD